MVNLKPEDALACQGEKCIDSALARYGRAISINFPGDLMEPISKNQHYTSNITI